MDRNSLGLDMQRGSLLLFLCLMTRFIGLVEDGKVIEYRKYFNL